MREYTTERGVTIGIVPITLLLEKIREAHKMPPAPTYTEKLAGGGTQAIEITPAMAALWAKDNPDGWQEHAAGWEAYQAETDKRTAKLNDALWRAVMLKAIQLTVPSDGAWIEEQESMGLTVPDNPAERRIHYILTEAVGGAKDIIRIMAIASGADLTEDQLTAVEASFWDTIQRPQAIGPQNQGRPVADDHAGGDGAGG